MLPQLSTYLDDLVARIALDDDRREDARVAAGIVAAPEAQAEDDVPRRHGPVHHRVRSDVREYVVPDFRPGIDTCGIDLRTSKVEIMHWQGPGGTVLCVDDGREQLVIAFMGLDAPPFDDITLSFPKHRDGAPPVFEARAIAPGEISAENVVATPFAAPVGEGQLAEFWSFDARAEVIEVMRSPDAAGEVRVTVAPTQDCRDAMVTIDGRAAAILRGAPTATRRNVRVVASADI